VTEAHGEAVRGGPLRLSQVAVSRPGSFQPRPREERVPARKVLEVVLIFGLGLPERAGLADLGHDLAGPDAGGIEVGDRVLGDVALLVGRVEDLRPIAGADEVFAKVGPVDLQEELEKFPVGDSLGVEDDLDSLCVSGMVLVGRAVVLPTGVSDPDGDDSFAVAQ
jgi:hypothetical protein